MKKLCFLSTLLFVTTSSFAQTQLELNQAADRAYQQADKELNAVYQGVLKEYKDDAIFIKNAKTAQKVWIQFRDSEMKMKFPERENGYYGSVFPMCWSAHLTRLTKDRTRTLKVWLSGGEEGDVCSGSIKFNEPEVKEVR